MMKNKSKLIRSLTLILLIATLIAASIPTLGISEQSGNQNDKVRVLIEFKEFPGNSEAALISSHGGVVRHMYRIIPSIAAELPVKAIEALGHNPNIAKIEPDITVYTTDAYDTELSKTWGMLRIGEAIAHRDMGAYGNGVSVAIIDSGIDKTHPDLAANYAGGKDFVNGDNDPNDIDGHGTHVAGTIAAVRDGNGVVGAAPSVKIYALKALEGGGGYFSDIIAALDWVVAFNENPANTSKIRVTNNSYGSSGDPGTQVKAAFDAAYASGVLSIASAGNSGNRNGVGDNVGYPARYPSVVAVAASDSSDKRAYFSSTGPDVELIAPGVSIYSTYINSSYAYLNGTSMASPHVVGVAAQVFGANSSLTNVEVRGILQSTAKDLGLPARYQGYGLVQAVAAVEAANPVAPVYGDLEGVVKDEQNQVLAGVTINVSGTSFSAETDSNGYYAITGLTPGSYTVQASLSGYNTAQSTVEIIADQTTTQDFVLTEHTVSYVFSVSTSKTLYPKNSTVTITASLNDSGTPVSGAPVTVTLKSPTGSILMEESSVTDSSGNAIFSYKLAKKAASGTYSVTASTVIGVDTMDASTTFNVK